MSHFVNADQEPEVSAVAEAVPDGWGAIILLVRAAPQGGLDVRTGGVRINRKTSITLLREVLAELERLG